MKRKRKKKGGNVEEEKNDEDVRCEKCGWYGTEEDCPTDTSEGLDVLVCPDCGNII